MHNLTGQIRNRHISTLRKREEYLAAILKADTQFTKIFQARELAAIRAVLLCAVEVPDDSENAQET